MTTIRRVTVEDSEAVAHLVSHLGYPATSTQVPKRLSSILHDEDYDTLVACDDGLIVGFIGTRIGRAYESDDPYGQIMALVVAADHQRRGIGRALMQAAESTLAERGARALILTSGNHRAGAHAFYESCGYTFTGRRYRKSIAPSASMPSW